MESNQGGKQACQMQVVDFTAQRQTETQGMQSPWEDGQSSAENPLELLKEGKLLSLCY